MWNKEKKWVCRHCNSFQITSSPLQNMEYFFSLKEYRKLLFFSQPYFLSFPEYRILVLSRIQNTFFFSRILNAASLFQKHRIFLLLSRIQPKRVSRVMAALRSTPAQRTRKYCTVLHSIGQYCTVLSSAAQRTCK